MLPFADDSRRRGPRVATLTFLAMLIVVFLWQLTASRGTVIIPPNLAFVPGLLFGGATLPAGTPVFPPPATLVTYQFFHGGWAHLLGNLLFLWVFGPQVEDTLGSGRFTVLVIICGILAAFAQAWPDPSSAGAMIGASGGISGILGAYLVFHPRSEIRVLVPVVIVPRVVVLPAFIILAAWFLLQLLYTNWSEADPFAGGVAFGAHVAGFVGGMLLGPLLAPARFAARFRADAST